MCELFGVSADKPIELNNYLREFFSHGDQHPHGWGFACRTAYGVDLEKEPVTATKSAYLKKRLEEPIVASHALAHIRLATAGSVKYANCHPFLGTDIDERRLMFVHNGITFENELIRPYFNREMGETDSEGILLLMLERFRREHVNVGRRLKPEERFKIIDDLVCELAPHNKCNFILDDGEYTYVHNNYTRELLLTHVPAPATRIFSTRPLSVDVVEWERVPFTRLSVWKGDSLVYLGRDHGAAYVQDSREQYLYCEYAML